VRREIAEAILRSGDELAAKFSLKTRYEDMD
jgi:hypothetical protein